MRIIAFIIEAGSIHRILEYLLNTIPLSMIDRINVLPTGSSAIYGREALAGVVNIVLRSNFDGAETSLGYKGPTSQRRSWGDRELASLTADRFSSSFRYQKKCV
jgi:iron complex outermembrane recepter protein